jgi:CRP/FNR family transcriptional regulator
MSGRTLTFHTGSTIYSPFVDERSVFIIELGYVMAYTHQDDGKRRIHLIYGPGAYFPVITTFKNAQQRATYESISQVVLTKYSRNEFVKALKADPALANRILDKTVDQLSIFADIVVNLQVSRLEDKLLNRLKDLAKAHGVPEKGLITLPYKLKHHHLSDMLGSERESVSRALNSLKRKSLITIDSQGKIAISIKA